LVTKKLGKIGDSSQLNDIPVVFRVEADQRVVPCETVLDDEGRYRSPGVLGKEHIMAHAEADDDVERCFRFVEKLRLEEGIASGFEFLRVSNIYEKF